MTTGSVPNRRCSRGATNTEVTASPMPQPKKIRPIWRAAPVERGTASAAYSFVRFSGGAVAPWLAGKLGEEVNIQLPFYVGAFAVLLAVGVLATGWKPLAHLRIPANHSKIEAEALTAADA